MVYKNPGTITMTNFVKHPDNPFKSKVIQWACREGFTELVYNVGNFTFIKEYNIPIFIERMKQEQEKLKRRWKTKWIYSESEG